VALWTEQLPLSLDALRAALTNGDPLAAAAAVHGLRGSSANVGARRLAEVCGDFERQARGGATVADLAGLAVRVEDEAESARLALTATVDGLLAREGEGGEGTAGS
jgi:HPt (histidine-containing phosphotransfer) domain-containing protein